MTASPKDKSTLYLISGKIASGKSTLASQLAKDNSAILLSQDEWLSTLYPDEIQNLQDYKKYFSRFAEVMRSHLVDLLKAGLSVVLDFPANTPQVRAWMRGIVEKSSCQNELHYLDVEDSVCLQRLRSRNTKGEHEYQVSEEEFHLFMQYFVPPGADEGFVVIHHKKAGS